MYVFSLPLSRYVYLLAPHDARTNAIPNPRPAAGTVRQRVTPDQSGITPLSVLITRLDSARRRFSRPTRGLSGRSRIRATALVHPGGVRNRLLVLLPRAGLRAGAREARPAEALPADGTAVVVDTVGDAALVAVGPGGQDLLRELPAG